LSNGSKPTQQNPDIIGFDTKEIYDESAAAWKSQGCTQNYFTENKSCLNDSVEDQWSAKTFSDPGLFILIRMQ